MKKINFLKKVLVVFLAMTFFSNAVVIVMGTSNLIDYPLPPPMTVDMGL